MINEISNEAIRKLITNVKTGIRDNTYNSVINEYVVGDIDNYNLDHEFAYCIDFKNGTRFLAINIILVVTNSKYLQKHIKCTDTLYSERRHTLFYIKFPYSFINDQYVCIPHLNTDKNVNQQSVEFINKHSLGWLQPIHGISNDLSISGYLSDGIIIDSISTKYPDICTEYVPDFLSLFIVGRWK